MTWNFHVDDYDKGRYEMILGRDLFKRIMIKYKII